MKCVEQFRSYAWMQFNHSYRPYPPDTRTYEAIWDHPVACDELYGDGKPIFLSSFQEKNSRLSKAEDEERANLREAGPACF